MLQSECGERRLPSSKTLFPMLASIRPRFYRGLLPEMVPASVQSVAGFRSVSVELTRDRALHQVLLISSKHRHTATG